LFGPGPKRILALDGGGVRGVLSIALLERIEEILRARAGGDPRFRLCDYFDLIGGTSTGSILATMLALGHTATELKDLFFNLAPQVFRKTWFRQGLFVSKFDGRELAKIIHRKIGEVELGSAAIHTGLAIASRRVDTASNWIIFNNPKSLFFDDGVDQDGKRYRGNKHYRLVDLVRASTAAPYYFQPQLIPIGQAQMGLFIDGGLTLHNNPSLQLLMLAALKGYCLEWPLSTDKLLMISLGTGGLRQTVVTKEFNRRLSIDKTRHALQSTITTGEDLVETVMQWLSEPEIPRNINSEIGTLAGEVISGIPQLTYQRYNATLTGDWLGKELGLSFSPRDLKRLCDMTDPRIVGDVYEIGRRVADKFVSPEHLPVLFDAALAPGAV
jgi:hypothetical protein